MGGRWGEVQSANNYPESFKAEVLQVGLDISGLLLRRQLVGVLVGIGCIGHCLI